MRTLTLFFLLGCAVIVPSAAGAADSKAGVCSPETAGEFHCVFRSLLPSVGIVASCRTERDCRVGYYYGAPADAVWFTPPSGMTTLPRPEVRWLTATFAQVRFDCGGPCTVSYFFEARRRRLSAPRSFVLAVDHRRLLLAAADGPALTIRQLYSYREVLRIERDWAPGAWLGDAVSSIQFDPDGRLSLTWLRGADRVPVSERLSVPSVPRR